MNTSALLSQLAALETLMINLHDDAIPEHTRAKLWTAINDVVDARCVISIQQQLEERRTGVVTVHQAVAEMMD